MVVNRFEVTTAIKDSSKQLIGVGIHMKKVILAFSVFALLWGQASADLVFDNFNATEGHFGYAPTFSGTTVGEDASSTIDRVLTDGPREGVGHQKLVLVHDTSTTAFRLRHVSGGPPYNTANAGTPVGNAGFSFTTGTGTDGWIGFYLRTTATGWQTSINLDGPTGAIAEMDGSSSVPIISDGQWHLYEWNLDATTGWGAVPGIGGGHGGAVANGSHTIDSIYFRDLDGSPGPTATFFLDFVALNSDGSVALITPAAIPEAGSFAAMGLVGLLSAAAIWIRKRVANQAAA
jgi:hypothetical protein